MFALTLLAACSNLDEKTFFPEGGVRTATGGGIPEDTGGLRDTGDTGGAGGDGAPTITDTACYFADSDAGDVILCEVYYLDAESDLLSGYLYYDLYEDQSLSTSGRLRIVTEAAADDPSSDAPDYGDYIGFQILGVDTSATYIVDAIVLQDTAGHTSNEASQEVSQ